MNSDIISDALAQVTENGIGLGNIFNKFKVDLDSYIDVIKKFSQLDFEDSIYKLNDGKANWDAIAKAIEGCDDTALSYFKTLDNGNGTINNQAASIEGLSKHLQKARQWLFRRCSQDNAPELSPQCWHLSGSLFRHSGYCHRH